MAHCLKPVFVCLVIDTNDRFLRKITIGQSATEKGYEREVRFISVAGFQSVRLAVTATFSCIDKLGPMISMRISCD